MIPLFYSEKVRMSMETVNQLVLDCVAKVLRINETTDAEISFEIDHCKGIYCFGWKSGYASAIEERGEKPDPDFTPLGGSEECIYIDMGGAGPKLRSLLQSLNRLEKWLLGETNSGEKADA